MLIVLREPRSARETQGGVGVFKEVYHVVKGAVLLAVHFCLKGLVAGIKVGGVFPESTKLLDGVVLLEPLVFHSTGVLALSVLIKILDDHI